MSLSACTQISSGGGFLRSSLLYFDCAGKTLGEAGYVALTQPGSIISQITLTAITLFIAWHGVRIMFGRIPDMGGAVLGVAKIGLVLMLVTSWPAVRTLIANPSFAGPGELAAQAGAISSLPLGDRLQRADDGIVALTTWGTGKLDIRAGRTADGQPAASAFSGIALTDNLALGLGRLCFLVGSLMSFGLLRLLTGAMISALPIFAGLLLFESTRGVFRGWLRLIFALFVASFAIPLILIAELSLLEPWLARTIEQRSAFYATPSAPTELLAISGSFLLILIGSAALIAKMCFAVDVAGVAGTFERWRRSESSLQPARQSASWQPVEAQRQSAPSRAESLSASLDRLSQSSGRRPLSGRVTMSGGVRDQTATQDGLGNLNSTAPRRTRQRMTLSHARRNQP